MACSPASRNRLSREHVIVALMLPRIHLDRDPMASSMKPNAPLTVLADKTSRYVQEVKPAVIPVVFLNKNVERTCPQI
jgi:hypothetical protein